LVPTAARRRSAASRNSFGLTQVTVLVVPAVGFDRHDGVGFQFRDRVEHLGIIFAFRHPASPRPVIVEEARHRFDLSFGDARPVGDDGGTH
jgi:hypothetical protein